MRGFRMVESFSRLTKAARAVQSTRPLCTKINTDKAIATKFVTDDAAYRQLEKLDFMTAAKILFTDPPKKKKFGLYFDLVQFFFVCMPSLAVYLVAQYARYEIRRMEALNGAPLSGFLDYIYRNITNMRILSNPGGKGSRDEKETKEEEEKAKEMEANALKESEEAEFDPELFKVKVRLEALEEAVKEIVVESKKLLGKSEEVSKGGKLETVISNPSEIAVLKQQINK